MANPIIKIHNAETGEVIEREMNADELAVYQAGTAIPEPTEDQLKAIEAKNALLAKLGITEDEAKLLLS